MEYWSFLAFLDESVTLYVDQMNTYLKGKTIEQIDAEKYKGMESEAKNDGRKTDPEKLLAFMDII